MKVYFYVLDLNTIMQNLKLFKLLQIYLLCMDILKKSSKVNTSDNNS